MFFVFNPYNEKSKKHQGKFINLDDHIKEWLSYFVKKYLNLTILRSTAIVLVLILLMQLAPAVKSLPAGAQGNFPAANSLDHWAVSDPGNQTAGVPFDITITPKDAADNTITTYDWTVLANRPSFSGLSVSPFGNTPVYNYQPATGGVATYAVITYASEAGVQIAATGGESPSATGANPTPFNIIHNPSAAAITINPDPYTATAGDGVTYTAQANDVYDNPWDVTSSTAFSIVEPGHGGSWLNNVYTTHTSGTWTVRGAYLGMISEATLNVIHAAAKSIKITPDPYTAVAGESITYVSKAKDDYNNVWDATTETAFTINKEASGNWTANIYKSEKEGSWTVTGTYITNPATTDTASLRINPKPPITPKSQSIQGEVAGAEIGIASSIGPQAAQPEVLAESTIGPSWFAEVPFPFKFFSAAGLASQAVADWASNLGILFIILGALMLLTSFLGWFGFLPTSTKPVQKSLWNRK